MANSFFFFLLLFVLPTLSSIFPLHSPISAFFSHAQKTDVYIVYMGGRKHHDPNVVTNSHHEMLAKLLQSEEAARNSMVYSYTHGFSGFAATLTESEAKQVAEFPGVIRVIPNQIYELHTTRSWDFLGLYPSADNLVTEGKEGEGVIIGVIDTGIWPESKSFDDTGMGPVPTKWKGICEEGTTFNTSNCNKKLIGARWFITGVKPHNSHILGQTFEDLSPRDIFGHGTHTASIAAGSLVQDASFMGVAKGVAKGGAPRAHIAMYKVCWTTVNNGTVCQLADVIKGFDQAIADGVDVITASLGKRPPLFAYEYGYDMATFHAVDNGIVVVSSAGNSGPVAQSVCNTAPWMLTVGASTIDRSFPTKVKLGNNATYTGQALYSGKNSAMFYQLAFGGSCIPETLDPKSFAGKVVLCYWNATQQDYLTADIRIADGNVAKVNGAGVIFVQPPTNQLASCGSRPCIAVSYVTGAKIYHYIQRATREGRSPAVTFSSSTTTVGNLVSPTISYFSSRGPSSLSPAILKPDIAAPGSDILGAWSAASPNLPGEYMILSGTSTAGPHISGIVALLKVVHPDWSPAAIKSALVTTASTTDAYGQQIEEESGVRKPADPFDYGGGFVNPNAASNPGLIYNMTIKENAISLCAMGYSSQEISNMTNMFITCPLTSSSSIMLNLNLPSITIPNLKDEVVITRTVTNVDASKDAHYKANVKAPSGVGVSVSPQSLLFNATTSELTFRVQFKVAQGQQKQGFYTFGSLTWSDGSHNVRIPISVRTTLDDDDDDDDGVSWEGNYNIVPEEGFHLSLQDT